MGLNDDIINIQLAGYLLYWQDRTAVSGKTRGSRLCIFVNYSWCTISKEVSRFCSPEVEYLMISYRPHYLPQDFSSVFIVAVYIPPQTDAGTKTVLNERYSAICKQENAHPEAVLLVAGDFNEGKLKFVLPNIYHHVKCLTRWKKNSGPSLLYTQRRIQSSPSPSI